MGYDKGTLSRNQIVAAASAVILERGFGATSIADLSKAAETSAGKLTHHFPTKGDLFETVFRDLMQQFADPLARLADPALSPLRRLEGFFDGMLELYGAQTSSIGCPIGHAAGDSEGVSPAMRREALEAFGHTETLFARVFLDLGDSPDLARAKAMTFVAAWQGAVVVARAGRGIAHIREVFRGLTAMAAPSGTAERASHTKVRRARVSAVRSPEARSV